MRGDIVVDRVRRARENNTLGCERKIGDLLGARQHLSVDIELTETAGDEVRVLRTVQRKK